MDYLINQSWIESINREGIIKTISNIKANIFLIIIALIVISTSLNESLFAQSEEKLLAGFANYELDFPIAIYQSETEDFALLYQDHLMDNTEIKEIDQNTVLNKDISSDFGIFIIDLIEWNYPSIHWKNPHAIKYLDKNTKYIICDDYVPVMAWLESEKSFVKINSDLNQNESTAVVYRSEESKTAKISSFEINK